MKKIEDKEEDEKEGIPLPGYTRFRGIPVTGVAWVLVGASFLLWYFIDLPGFISSSNNVAIVMCGILCIGAGWLFITTGIKLIRARKK